MSLALERKLRSEEKLRSIGIEPLDSIPAVVEESQVKLRTAEEVAKKVIIWYALIGIIFYDHPEEIVYWIKSEGLWDELSPREKDFLMLFINTDADVQSREQQALSNSMAWRAEGIQILLWSLGMLEHLQWPEEKWDGSEMHEIIPGLGESTQPFIEQASLRSTEQILDCVDLHYRLHMMMQESEEGPDEILTSFNPMIVYERIHALAWLVNWDEEWNE